MDKELWKDVTGYEGLYQVSNFGKVRKVDGTLMQGNINSYGYHVVSLTKDGKKKDKKVHRLVAMAFVPPIVGKDFVNHKDGDKINNCAENLEWCTRGENTIHAIEVLEIQRNSYPVWQLSKDGRLLGLFVNAATAAQVVEGNSMMISACCRGTAQSAYGYCWQYALNTETKRLVTLQRIDALKINAERLQEQAAKLEAELST